MNTFKSSLSILLFFIASIAACSQKRGNIDRIAINDWILDYIDSSGKKINAHLYNETYRGNSKIICINCNLDSLEFFLVYDSANQISYYKNFIEKSYRLQWESRVPLISR